MSVSNALKATLASTVLSAGLTVVSPAQANPHQSCQDGNLVTLRKNLVWMNWRFMLVYEMDVYRDHPSCRAEK